MPLENVSGIDDLNELWPLETDPIGEGNEQIQNIKKAVKATGLQNARHLTLAQAQASDLKVGQYVRLKDFGNDLFELLPSAPADYSFYLTVGSLFAVPTKPEILVGSGDTPTIETDGSKQTVGLNMTGYVMVGDNPQPTNDNAVLTLLREKNAIISGNRVDAGYNSMSIEYGDSPPAGEERRTVDSIIASNIVKGDYLGYEAFSSARNAYAGNVAVSNKSDKGTQHGLRITGYGEDHLGQGHDLRNIGNSYTGFVLSNYSNGISRQTGSYGNIVSASISDCTNGILLTENTTLADAISSSNVYTFAITNVSYGGFAYDPKAEMFRGTIKGATTLGWYTKRGARDATANSYDLVIQDAKDAARFEDNNSFIKIVACDLQEGGVIVTGDYNIVDVVIDDQNISGATDPALTISGNGNIVRFCGYALRQNFSEVIVSGNQNQLQFNGNYTLPQGQVAVTGQDNIIKGHCHITAASNSDNDYSGVYKWSGQGEASITTDVNGVASLAIHADMPSNISGYSLDLSCTEFTNPRIVTRKGSNDQFIVTDAQTGAIVTSTTMTIRYHYVAFK